MKRPIFVVLPSIRSPLAVHTRNVKSMYTIGQQMQCSDSLLVVVFPYRLFNRLSRNVGEELLIYDT
jgi:hypothetical protein